MSGQKRSTAKKKLMVVDDEPEIANLYSFMLQREGFQVGKVAHDGYDAVQSVQTSPQDFDIVIIDQKMPKMNGIEASDRIKDIRPDITLIMVTAYEIPKQEGGMFFAILRKPVSKAQLIDAVRKAVSY